MKTKDELIEDFLCEVKAKEQEHAELSRLKCDIQEMRQPSHKEDANRACVLSSAYRDASQRLEYIEGVVAHLAFNLAQRIDSLSESRPQ